jgi:bifunctional oligoribonuclease and PAP phosphatase NrnA
MSEGTHNLNSQIDPNLVQQALAMIQPAQRIALLAHESPDGDCIGYGSYIKPDG